MTSLTGGLTYREQTKGKLYLPTSTIIFARIPFVFCCLFSSGGEFWEQGCNDIKSG